MKYDCMSPNRGVAPSSTACASGSLATLAPITKYSASPSWEVPPRLSAYAMESEERVTDVVEVWAVVDDETVVDDGQLWSGGTRGGDRGRGGRTGGSGHGSGR